MPRRLSIFQTVHPVQIPAKLRNWYRHRSVPTKFVIWVIVIGIVCALLWGFGGGPALGASNVEVNISSAIGDWQNATGIALLGHVYNVDTSSRSMQVSWLVVGCGGVQKLGTSYGGNCGQLDVPTDFHTDGSSQSNASYDPSSPLNEIETSHNLQIPWQNRIDQLYIYPFDTYLFSTTISAVNINTNDSIPIFRLIPIDATDNFSPSVLVDTANATSDYGYYIQIQLRRTALTHIFVLTVFILNWALTAAVMYITLLANDRADVHESLLVLPLSVIVTLPSLRALWAGAPTFGLLLDFCGIFFQMVIVSVCSIFLIVTVGLRNKASTSDGETRHRRLLRRHSDLEDASLSDMERTETHALRRTQRLRTRPSTV